MSESPANPRLVRFGGLVLTYLEMVGLGIITIATLAAGVEEVIKMITLGKVTLGDLLLLFIYLEVLTMVGAYLQSGALPIRMPLYIAMVALARHLILDMKEITEWEIIATSAAILVISVAVLIIRFGHVRFPYDRSLGDHGPVKND
jgi:protein PsiE